MDIVFGYKVLDPQTSGDLIASISRYIEKRVQSLETKQPDAERAFWLAYESNEVAEANPEHRLDLYLKGLRFAEQLLGVDETFFELHNIMGRNGTEISVALENQIDELWSAGDRTDYRMLEANLDLQRPLIIKNFDRAYECCLNSANEEPNLRIYARRLLQNKAMSRKQYAQFLAEKSSRRISAKHGGSTPYEAALENIHNIPETELQAMKASAEHYTDALELYTELFASGDFMTEDDAFVALGNLGSLLILCKTRENYEMARIVYRHAKSLRADNELLNDRFKLVETTLEANKF